jgi:hypothetical protein
MHLLILCAVLTLRSSVFWDVTQRIASKLLTFRDNLPVPFSRVKHDSVGKNHCSTLRKVPKDHGSHFVVDYILPAKPVLFLMENQHCQAIMPQEAVNNCLTCIKCAEV